MYLNLNSVDKVKMFVNEISKLDANKVSIDLGSDRYIVDARSILGIFSLDLSKPVKATIFAENEKDKEEAVKFLEKYVA